MTLQCTCLHTYYVHVHIVVSVAACDQLYFMLGVLDPLPYCFTLKLLHAHTFLPLEHFWLYDALLAGYTKMSAFSILQDVYAMIQ